MSTPLILLVSRSASRSQCYREVLDKLGISCLVISEIKEVPTLTTGTPFSGILLDMPVLIKATANDKTAMEDILKALPSAYLNIAPASDAIRLLAADGTQGIAKTVEEFALLCKEFTPRIVRPKDRFPLHLNALLARETAPEQQEQTVTLNISSQGCFLFSVKPEFQVNQLVSIKFIGLTDTTLVQASICWLRRWGEKGHHLPGIGVKFEKTTENQAEEINKLIEALKPR
jgi:hypothetical protein